MVIFLLGWAGLSGALPAMEIYHWVDPQGRAHYGDRPPQSQSQSHKIDLPDGVTAPPPDQRQYDLQRRQRRQRLLDSFREERQKKRRARQQAQERKQRLHRECAKARQRLRHYETAGLLYEPLADGGRRYLADSERRAEIERLRAELRRWCDG